MAKKKDVTKFLNCKIRELTRKAIVKDCLGKFKWCSASRYAAETQLVYYKYLLRMIRVK